MLTASKTLPPDDVSINEKISSKQESILSCDICSKVYENAADLSTHKKRHKVDAPLVCSYCSRQYTDRHRYEVHVRFHTGETPFKCPICNKGFRDSRKPFITYWTFKRSLGIVVKRKFM